MAQNHKDISSLQVNKRSDMPYLEMADCHVQFDNFRKYRKCLDNCL